MNKRLVDPVHFFDHHGRSCLFNLQREKEIERLVEERDKLRRALKRLQARLDLIDPPKKQPEPVQSLH